MRMKILLPLLSLLPTSLAAMLCYDIPSPMRPDILVPVHCLPHSRKLTSRCPVFEKRTDTKTNTDAHQGNDNNGPGQDAAAPPDTPHGSGSPVPEDSPPKAAPNALEPVPKIPEPASNVPELAPKIPEPTSKIPEPAPKIPEPAPKVPEPAPNIPEPAPNIPKPADVEPLITLNPTPTPTTPTFPTHPTPPPMATTPTPAPPHEPPDTHPGPDRPQEPTDQSPSQSAQHTDSSKNQNPSPSQGSHNDGDNDDDDNDGDRDGQPEEPNLPYFDGVPDSPLSDILQAPALPPPSWDEDQAISFEFDCDLSDDTCKGISQTLDLAGWYVSQIIHFSASVSANVTVVDYCKVYNQCGSSANADVVLGGGNPSRQIPLRDDDGVIRLYPQAVVRQMTLPKGQTPQYKSVDMILVFNSKADFFFEKPKGGSIQSHQFDFLTVAIHEIIHGLGFISSWNDYLETGPASVLTPYIAAVGNSLENYTYEGFVEFSYDRLISLTHFPGLFATNISAQMTDEFGHLGDRFIGPDGLANAFFASNASTLGRYMVSNATENGTMQQFLPVTSPSNATLVSNYTSGPLITLETSFNPFLRGSSLIHMDGDMYESTQDFLMRSSTPAGKKLKDLIAAYGDTADATYGPFGPGLRYILAGIGYRIRGGIPLGGSPLNAKYESEGNTTSSTNPTKKSHSNRHDTIFTFWFSVYWVLLGSGMLFHC